MRGLVIRPPTFNEVYCNVCSSKVGEEGQRWLWGCGAPAHTGQQNAAAAEDDDEEEEALVFAPQSTMETHTKCWSPVSVEPTYYRSSISSSAAAAVHRVRQTE